MQAMQASILRPCLFEGVLGENVRRTTAPSSEKSPVPATYEIFNYIVWNNYSGIICRKHHYLVCILYIYIYIYMVQHNTVHINATVAGTVLALSVMISCLSL